MTLRVEALASAALFSRVAHAALWCLTVGLVVGAASALSLGGDPTLARTLGVSAVGLLVVDVAAIRPAGWYLKRAGA